MSDAKDPKARRRAGGSKRDTARKAARASQPPGVDESRDLALVVATAALEKKALAIEILDVVGKVDYADFLVLMTGRSNRHVDALAQAVDEACSKKKKRALSVEGLPAASWVLIDYGDVVVHIFQEQARGLYDIEGLWLDAKRLPVPGDGATAATDDDAT
jgi:ribosome-associated protein